MKLKPLHAQVVVIVGATSGIGREAALQFAAHGSQVIVAGRDGQAITALADKIRSRDGSARPHVADVSRFEDLQALAERAVQAYGRIDTWVHAAAVSLYAPFQETQPDEFRRIIEVNLLGQAYGAMAALPHLRRHGGALIHIGSVESKRSFPLHSAYAASKHGMIGFIDALRVELLHDQTPVSVTTILPAGINTPFFEKSRTRLGVKPRPSPPIYEPELVARAILYAAQHPVRELYVGGGGRLVELLHRLAPGTADWIFSRAAYRVQLTEEPKSDQAPNNLYEHAEGYDRVHGSFGDEARTISLYTDVQMQPALASWLLAGLAATSLAWLFRRRLPRLRRLTAW